MGDEPINLDKVRKERNKGSDNNQKIKPSQIQDDFANAIDGEILTFKGYSFSQKFHVFFDISGKSILFEEFSAGLVRQVSIQRLVTCVLNFSRSVSVLYPQYLVDIKSAENIAKHWLLSTRRSLKEFPRAFVEKSDKRLSFFRLNFDYDNSTINHFLNEVFLESIKDKKIPTEGAEWVDIFYRSSDWKALAAFIGSLFYEQSDRQQYLYIYGSGRNGKGSLMRLLNRIFGTAYHSDDPTLAKGNRFWTQAFIGKRLVVFPDANTPTFTQTGAFKTLTGDDGIRIEEKGGAIFTTQLQAKFIFLSNERLQISSNEADLRRAIFVEFAALDETTKLLSTTKYDAILDKSAEHMINFCRAVYCWLCPDHETIPVDKEQLLNLAEEAEECHQVTFEHCFEEAEGSILPASTFSAALKHEGLRTNKEQNKFKEWLERTKKIRRVQKTVKNPNGSVERKRIYENLRAVQGKVFP